jgi:hypothetical protein
MGLARRPDGDLDVLSEGAEKVHEAFHGEGAGAVAHQSQHVGLFDPQNLAGFRRPTSRKKSEMWGTQRGNTGPSTAPEAPRAEPPTSVEMIVGCGAKNT